MEQKNPYQAELELLIKLIKRVHAAKGRYHTQMAMCDLFDAVALPNKRPGQEDPVLASKSVTTDEDPCPGCRKGVVCRTPACGRLALNRVEAPTGHKVVWTDEKKSLLKRKLEEQVFFGNRARHSLLVGDSHEAVTFHPLGEDV
jgi:hypothetical protein